MGIADIRAGARVDQQLHRVRAGRELGRQIQRRAPFTMKFQRAAGVDQQLQHRQVLGDLRVVGAHRRLLQRRESIRGHGCRVRARLQASLHPFNIAAAGGVEYLAGFQGGS
ncbi:hypothetical protein G6F50_017762 [Rhizopus delemar]|uniref:Uncharacterized protein n=1 Tax=Rhizopus delemar TaxID=936053 RepID=A0A9P7C0C5_9FUNG|nr:hypothetical protein G6F50_017762 [Rhizopus delemar]